MIERGIVVEQVPANGCSSCADPFISPKTFVRPLRSIDRNKIGLYETQDRELDRDARVYNVVRKGPLLERAPNPVKGAARFSDQVFKKNAVRVSVQHDKTRRRETAYHAGRVARRVPTSNGDP